MNSQSCKWLVSFAVFFCLIVVSSSATAIKPIKPSPPDDPCTSMESFTPDIAFWRSTGKRKNPMATFFLAESVNGCEKVLFDFPLSEGGDQRTVRGLKFSSVISEGDFFGRVVWLDNVVGNTAVWSYDFYIAGVEVISSGSFQKILVSDEIWMKDVNGIDLSPDMTTLAFLLHKESSVTGEHDFSIRIVDIETCLSSVCTFDDERTLVIKQSIPEIEYTHYLSYPAWDPLGTRIYTTRTENDYKVLEYTELNVVWEQGEWLGNFYSKDLYSSETQPQFKYMRRLASGVMDDFVYLAVEFPHEKINCGYIYFIKVEDCESENDPVCFTEPEFVGQNPSWTRDGKVVHHYYEPKTRSCSVYGGKIGIYDGTNLDVLGEGYFPDAAGG